MSVYIIAAVFLAAAIVVVFADLDHDDFDGLGRH